MTITAKKIPIIKGRYLLPEWPAPPSVKAFTSVRGAVSHAGYGSGHFFSFNMKFMPEENADNVRHHRNTLMKDWELVESPVWLEQVHGTRVIDAFHFKQQLSPKADASWTDHNGLPCVVMSADCLPVLLCDRKGTRVAAVHAGWRGLAGGILEKTIRAMAMEPKELIAWLGPAICDKHFEIGPEVRDRFIRRQNNLADAFFSGKSDRWHASLYQIARIQMQSLGVRQIHGGNYCTFEQKTLFFSHRREKPTGRMATVIWLNNSS